MKRLLPYFPAFFCSLAIPLLSLANFRNLPDTPVLHFAGLDKVIHLLMYAALTSFWLYPMSSKRRARPAIMLGVVLAAVLYGALMEVFQALFTTCRAFEILDILANLGGAMIAAAGFYFYSKWRGGKLAENTEAAEKC
ncbi:MAG: VanZ family protein [Kiritimatiellia bacterium]